MSHRLSRLGCLLLCVIWGHEAHAEIATVIIKAGVVEAPCNIELSSWDQTVELPPVATNVLTKPGDHSAVTWFSINLRGCLAEGGDIVDSYSQVKTWAPNSAILAVRFNGVRDDFNAKLLSVTGSAKGVAIALVDRDYNTVTPGIFDTPIITRTIRDKIIYGAEVIRTASTLSPGDYRAVVDFVINYE